MDADEEVLEKLNLQIGAEESKGDNDSKNCFKDFLRADGATFDNRDKFIEKIKPSDKRKTDVLAINIFENRAIVACIVTLKSSQGDRKFHNLRLFVRNEDKWQLLGWANESME